MESSFERLDKYLKYKGLSDNYLTTHCGLSAGLLSRARNGKNGLSSATIQKILRNLTDINGEWLLTGEGEMIKPSTMIEQANVNGNNEATVHHDDVEISNIRLENERLKAEVQQLRERLQKFEELYDRLLESVLPRQ